jgi:hypothetical protein
MKIIRKIAYLFYHILTVALTLWTVAGIVNVYGVYKIYQAFKDLGMTGILHTKWSLYLLIWIVVLLAVKEIHYLLYKFSQED